MLPVLIAGDKPLYAGPMLRRWVAFVLVLCAAVLVSPRIARADTSTAHGVAVAVLALDSDDAEEQADALTGALRSRVRASQGWALVETTQSLGMLTAALRCPGKPIPADCEQRIADHLKSDRFIFGYVTKGPQAGLVTAEVHLYQKSKPDTIIRESFSDNLKDANDDALRQRAAKILDRLGGSAVGTIVVKMGTENGEIIVDGEKHVPLQNGVARVDLSPGTHSVEASTKAGGTQKRNVAVTVGKETVVDLALAGTATPGPAEPPKEENSKPLPVRKIVGGGLMVVGVAGGVVAVLMALKYSSDNDDAQSKNDELHKSNNGAQVPELPPGKTAGDVCGNAQYQRFTSNHPICQLQDDAKTHSTIALVSGIVGGAALIGGAVLFFTGGSAQPSERDEKTGLKSVKFNPLVGNTNGFLLSGAF